MSRATWYVARLLCWAFVALAVTPVLAQINYPSLLAR